MIFSGLLSSYSIMFVLDKNIVRPSHKWRRETDHPRHPNAVTPNAFILHHGGLILAALKGGHMSPKRLERITIEPGKCGGRPCIRGERIRVTDILGLLGSGASHSEILEDYPFLEEEDIFAALEYAAI